MNAIRAPGCASRSGPGNSTGDLARFDGTYEPTLEWSGSVPYDGFDERPHLTLSFLAGNVTVSSTDPYTCDVGGPFTDWNCLGSGIARTGTVRQDGWGEFTFTGKSNSGKMLEWKCGFTAVHPDNGAGGLQSRYTIQGACSGSDFKPAPSCYGRLVGM